MHVHATIANHDLVSDTAIAHGTDHATVKHKNNRLSREMGFTVVGPEPAKEKTTWAERKEQFGIESFERLLGNRVEDARNHANNMEEFLEELKIRDVELTETRKVDKKTGKETVGWSYKSHDTYGKSNRKRRRRASNLADDLTREGIEAYFEEKQHELETQEQAATTPEVLPDVPETAEPEEQPSTDSALDVYDLDQSDVSEMASDLQKVHIHRSCEEGKPFMDERYERLVEVQNHPDEQLAKLREDGDAARREFHVSKEALDTLQSPCPGLLAGMHVFAKAGRNAKDLVSRMMADMTAMMLRMMIAGARGGTPQAARGGGEARAHAASCREGRAACGREDAEVSGQGHAVRRVAEKMRGQRQAGPEVRDSPHVQIKLLVVEHRLVGVLHEERRVLHDVPLENLVPRCPVPAHGFERAAGNLVCEHHPAARLGEVGVGLDAVVTHRSHPPLPAPRFALGIPPRSSAWCAGSRSRCSP